MTTPETILLAVYYAALTALVAFGAHRLVLTVLFLRHGTPRCEPLPEDALPSVTVQLPMYNERYVAERLIDAAAALDYPRDRLQIQVLDDSTDDTRDIVDRAAARARERGTSIDVVRRAGREGYKAGALDHGMDTARGEFIAIFDADFVPPRDFLRRTVAGFDQPRVGMVQARWDHINRDFSALTRAQAVLLDGHFVVEQSARCATGRFFNFNGTAGVWRRAAIDDAGGWQHDTITEDLDLSYRAQLGGWRFRYLPDVSAPAELPAEMRGLRSQQHRWAKGSIECLRKLGPALVRGRLPARVRAEAFVHLTANLSYVLMLIVALTMPIAALVRQHASLPLFSALDVALFTLGIVSVATFYAVSERWLGRPVSRTLALLPFVIAVDIGLSLHKSRAVIEAIVGYRTAFVRTPKLALTRTGSLPRTHAYLRSAWASGLGELALSAWCVAGIVLTLRGPHPSWWPLPFLALFAIGYATIGLAGVVQSFTRPHRARAALDPAGA